MEVFVEVIIEMAWIILIGFLCFIIYVYGKLFLIKIGLIKEDTLDDNKI